MIEANNFVQNLLEAVRKNQIPAIDVGEVTGYTQGKHLTTLNYGQTPPPDNTAPSVTVKVEKDNGAALNNKPMVSPFAWQKCGLIVPVYPGMRALLGHNLDLTNDAVVVGFLWSEIEGAEQQPPKNLPGDYWLCLPTELDENQQPTGKGVNDLTDKSGLRVIQAKGLRIVVGSDNLQDVGERPNVPGEKTIVIEHESGTKISIGNDGALEIKVAKDKDQSTIKMSSNEISMTLGQSTIKMSSNEISMTNGSVTLKLAGSLVSIS